MIRLFLLLTTFTSAIFSPDGKLKVELNFPSASYNVEYDGARMMENSPLGLVADWADFSGNLTLEGQEKGKIDNTYSLDRCKTASVHYEANTLLATVSNRKGQKLQIEFRVSNNDIAFRYVFPKVKGISCVRVMEEKTGFRFPKGTTTFMCPQSDAMIGWKRSKPSYEEEYTPDAPMNKRSQYGHGYTFPCLFHVGDKGWVLVSESGVDSRYCASHLSDYHNGGYTIAFPMAEENNGNGTVEPAMAMPSHTPWRTITVGSTLKPIVETTAPWDNVEALYEPSMPYKYGRSTWSWIIWQDDSMNWDDQITFIDLAADMGYEYILVDAGWDKQIGYDRMPELISYAQGKGVDVFLWYSSSGYWNDIRQSPINRMDNSIIRKKEMDWMQSLGVKGIKVDFWGGDKQETMRLYEQVLSDANDHGLMVIFHGCTLPRGWERMYPNYVGSEAVLASENLVFGQKFCDNEGFNACLHPFIRNTVGCMEFGGCVLNKRLHRSNAKGTERRTTIGFQLATQIIFQNPVQNVAITPNNLTDPECAEAIEFLKALPTTWEKTEFIDGYPGKSITLRRLHDGKWYTAHLDAATGDGWVKVE